MKRDMIYRKKIIFATISCLLSFLCGCSDTKQYDDLTDVDKQIVNSENQAANLSDTSSVKYEINDICYYVPASWDLKSESDTIISFQIDDNEKNIAVIQSEVIPEIMKIDAGKNAILNKEDVAEHYGIQSSIKCSIAQKEWLNTNNFEYCNIVFNSEAKLNDGEQDTRSGRSVVIPINENEEVFAVSILSYNNSDLDYIDVFLDNLTIETHKSQKNVKKEDLKETKTSDVEIAYNKACALTIGDLDRKINSFTGTQRYYYNGLIIQPEDEEWLNSSLNKEKTLNQGALYRTIANYLDGFSMGINNGSSYAEIMCGIEWTNKTDFEPYVENASKFIVSNNQIKAIMKEFQLLGSVSGEYDFDYGKFGKYTIDIYDLAACAKEMKISEEMLGYILAMLSEYAPTISFDNNSCHIDYKSYY